MSFSIQTNVNSLVAQENLRVNNDFQTRTINRLTSGYRINASGDDAAGLAVANEYRSDIAELSQGVRNANDGISALQIIDGGLSNITKILDRMKTLATQSASTTFKGNRQTLNTEYQSLLGEIDRQASNVGLVSGGDYNKKMTVFAGGGSSQANSQVNVDLSGGANQVNSSGLAINTSAVSGSGTELTGNDERLDNSAVRFLAGNTQVVTMQVYDGGWKQVQFTLNGGTDGYTGDEVIAAINTQTTRYGIAASISSNGELQFGGSTAFTVSVAAASGGNSVADASTLENSASYRAANLSYAAFAIGGGTSASITVAFQNATGSASLTVDNTNGGTNTALVGALNGALAGIGIYAVKDAAGTGYSIQSASDFSIEVTAWTAGGGGGTGSMFTSNVAGTKTVTDGDTTGGVTGNALSALTALDAAVQKLGLVQGRVGSGQNKLAYAVQLAQSQISNFSAAESRIRDADIASEAANLTKAQVLQQASMAAMAQANSAPQAVMALLRG